MIHKMKLIEKYFNYVLKGTKKVEIRLNDEKRKNININDIIIFRNVSNPKETIKVKVTDKVLYNNFEDLIDDIDISLLAGNKEDKKTLLKDLSLFYSEEEVKKYQVVAIYFKIIKEG